MIDESFTRGEVEDLTSLSKLDEQALLEELQARYQKNLIYVSRFGLPFFYHLIFLLLKMWFYFIRPEVHSKCLDNHGSLQFL